MPRDVRLIRSPVSVVGMVLTTTSATVFLVVLLADLFGLHTNPYIGILFFLILPAIFLAGLALIPLGAWLERRRRLAGKAARETHWPRLDLNSPAQRRVAVAVFGLTLANIVIVSLAAYRGVEYMDSVQFCGEVCHQVMAPEYTAFADAPHGRLACVQCHVGPGASGFARAKFSGVRRLAAVARGSYARPIVVPVRDLVPARDACRQCHRPQQRYGDVIRRVQEYADDAANTPSVTTLQVHIGGGVGEAGIHAHTNGVLEIDYIATDDASQVIPYVRVRDAQGQVREYVSEGVTPEQLAGGDRRRMDCVDCHNRPAHPNAPSPERAVDAALSQTELPASLPFVRREAVKALKADYLSQDAATEQIAAALRGFYRTLSPPAPPPQVERAVTGTTAIYRRNVFPDMKVGFGTYVNNIGHIDAPGCFRCHDDSHRSQDGRTIGQDCATCHDLQ